MHPLPLGTFEYFAIVISLASILIFVRIGILKPWPEIFHFALSATQSEVCDSLMIGDSWENDVAGAKGVGMPVSYTHLYKDGVNAGTVASDYIKSIIAIPQDRKLSVTMAEGGGCALKIYKK